MNFDFYAQYEHYSIAELLQILREPGAYQDAAVLAAERRLSERNPQAVEAERNRLFPAPPKLQESDTISIFDDNEPAYDPRQILVIRIIVIAVFAYYAVSLLLSLIPMVQLSFGETQLFGVEDLIIPAITTAWYAVPGILLLLPRQIGWYPAMIMMVMDLVTRSCFVITSLIEIPVSDMPGAPVQLMHLAVAAVMVYLLRSPGLRDKYQITDTGLRRTVNGAVAAGVVLVLYRLLLN